MGYKNFVKMPTLSALREALEYEPSNKLQPLRCRADFEGASPGTRLGFKTSGGMLVKLGTGTTYLRNIVWRVVEGSVPAGFNVDYINSDSNSIENLFLRNKHGEVRRPKSVPPESLIPIPGIVLSIGVAESVRAARHAESRRASTSTSSSPPWAD